MTTQHPTWGFLPDSPALGATNLPTLGSGQALTPDEAAAIAPYLPKRQPGAPAAEDQETPT